MSIERARQTLSDNERNVLRRAESTIAHGSNSFIEIGTALALIKDSQLYRETHETFSEYVNKRWGIKRAHGYRMIRSAQFIHGVREIAKAKQVPLPRNERQARILQRVKDPDQCCEVLRHAANLAQTKKIEYRHIVQAISDLNLGHSSKKKQKSLSNTDFVPHSEIRTILHQIMECLSNRTNCDREIALIKRLQALLTIHYSPSREDPNTPTTIIKIEGANTHHVIDCKTKSSR